MDYKYVVCVRLECGNLYLLECTGAWELKDGDTVFYGSECDVAGTVVGSPLYLDEKGIESIKQIANAPFLLHRVTGKVTRFTYENENPAGATNTGEAIDG